MADHIKEESARWLQIDAAYLYRMAREYGDRDGILGNWHARTLQQNAANSARMARQQLGIKE